jgi:uncharacterized protein YrrD
LGKSAREQREVIVAAMVTSEGLYAWLALEKGRTIIDENEIYVLTKKRTIYYCDQCNAYHISPGKTMTDVETVLNESESRL